MMSATPTMEAEHRLIQTVGQALGHAADLIESGCPADMSTLATAPVFLRTYADKLHPGKEDAMGFPRADKLLTQADQQDLREKFAEVDRAVGRDVLARLEKFAKSLTPAAQAPLPAAASAVGCECGCAT